jgi:hypothetical protein
MKFFSEVTKSFYNSAEDCAQAEKTAQNEQAIKQQKAKELSDARASRSKEIEEAMKMASEASEKVKKLVNDFIRDYGCYYSTVRKPSFNFFWDDFISGFLRNL